MDDLTLMQSFRAERVVDDEVARAAIWRALEARIEAATPAPVPIASSAPRARPVRRRRHLLRHRRLVAFAGATAAAAALAGVLVLSNGPTAQPAAAEILRQTAVVAASPEGSASSPLPGPGEFAYRKFKRIELKGWIPGGMSSGGGTLNRPGAFTALMPTTQEWWTAADGAGRVREVAGTPRFLTDAERQRWEAEGSRLPAPFDPEYQRKYRLAFTDALELRRGVVDWENQKMEGFRFPTVPNLPTDPETLRLAVEGNRIEVNGFNLMYPTAKRLSPEQAAAQLFNFLSEGMSLTPPQRAAVFNALAELPGIKIDTDATDFLGRQGYSIRSIDPETGGGFEFIFDPDTAAILAQREFLGKAGQSPYLKGLPSGFTIRETDLLEAGVVDSTHETAAEAEAGEPVASSGPEYRK